MEDLLDNSSIGKLAKEVSEELDIESMISGEKGIENLMDSKNMMNIFSSISKKLDDNKDGSMMEEAMNLSNNMKDNPIFSSLMSTMGQGLSQMDPSMNNTQPVNSDNSSGFIFLSTILIFFSFAISITHLLVIPFKKESGIGVCNSLLFFLKKIFAPVASATLP